MDVQDPMIGALVLAPEDDNVFDGRITGSREEGYEVRWRTMDGEEIGLLSEDAHVVPMTLFDMDEVVEKATKPDATIEEYVDYWVTMELLNPCAPAWYVEQFELDIPQLTHSQVSKWLEDSLEYAKTSSGDQAAQRMVEAAILYHLYECGIEALWRLLPLISENPKKFLSFGPMAVSLTETYGEEGPPREVKRILNALLGAPMSYLVVRQL